MRWIVRRHTRGMLGVAGALTIAAASALGVAGRATAAAHHPWYGIYDCMVPVDLRIVGGGVQPGYLKMMGRGRYMTALALQGRTMKATVPGRWRQRGSTIVWVSGTYHRARFYGVWNAPSAMHPKGFIAMFWQRTHTGTMIACYPQLDL
jgi:hypothetical protein